MEERATALVVIGASAGGVEAVSAVAAGLPADLAAAVAVVLHLRAGAESRLHEILARAGPRPAAPATDGEPLRAGRVYVAPPDRHLLVRGRRCVVAWGPRENLVRPSVDVLFRSAALDYGPRVVAVVLSGARDDGVAGAAAVDDAGGTVVVQDPLEALFPGMPSATVSRNHADRILPLAEIPGAIAEAVAKLSREVDMRENGRDEMSLETEYATLDEVVLDRKVPPGTPSTAEGALDAQSESLENALSAALRALLERAHLLERLAERTRRRGARRSSGRFEALAREAREQADVIRLVLAGRDAPDG